MSTHYYASAVIGFEIPETELFETVTIRHNVHPVPSGARFCPVCGIPAIAKEYIPLFDRDSLTLGGFDLDFAGGKVYVGRKAVGGEGGDVGFVLIGEDLVVLETQLRERLGKMGIQVDNCKFGLYAVLDCSY